MDHRLDPGLYLCPTPIGNLADITLRVLDTLRRADCILAEDTRHSGRLLKHYEITAAEFLSYHRHNEAKRREDVLARLRAGQAIALVSDAGSPGISDPGERLVAAAVSAGLPVTALPGASALIPALTVSGLPTDDVHFHGFPPRGEGRRRDFLLAQAPSASTHVFYESPRRVVALLTAAMEAFGRGRRAVLARELTKLHEEVIRGTLESVCETLSARESIRGECVLVIEGLRRVEGKSEDDLDTFLTECLRGGLHVKEAATAARAHGFAYRAAYRRALDLKPDPAP